MCTHMCMRTHIHVSEISYNLLQPSCEIFSIPERLYTDLDKNKPAILSCSFVKVLYEVGLKSWNSKYTQNVTNICMKPLSVSHMLFDCPVTTELFLEDGQDFTVNQSVTVHSRVGKLIYGKLI